MQVLTHHHNMNIKRNGPHFTFTDSQSLAILVYLQKFGQATVILSTLKYPYEAQRDKII